MLTDLDLAKLELDSYSAVPAGRVVDCGADRAVISYLPGATVVSIRGTDNPAGWISDFKAAGVVSKTHVELGACEAGFLEGALNLFPLLDPLINYGGVVLQGHSRGAGMVPILAGLMILKGYAPTRVVCWESPWAVGPMCRDFLLDCGWAIQGVQYWHGDDPVPCIPAVPWLVPNVWPIKHIGSWMIDPFDCHMMQGIVEALAAAATATEDDAA